MKALITNNFGLFFKNKHFARFFLFQISPGIVADCFARIFLNPAKLPANNSSLADGIHGQIPAEVVNLRVISTSNPRSNFRQNSLPPSEPRIGKLWN